MTFLLLLSISALLTSSAQAQVWNGTKVFAFDETGVFSAACEVTNPPVLINYRAGITFTVLSPTVSFLFVNPTTVYSSAGDSENAAGSTASFPAGTIIALSPGTSIFQMTTSTLRYGAFYGNPAIVNYGESAVATFKCLSQPYYFQAGTNPINYYNPGPTGAGGTTALYGDSGPKVGSVFNRRNPDGTLSPITCIGYSEHGWPIRTLENLATGEIQTSLQLSRISYLVTTPTETKLKNSSTPAGAFD